MFVTNFMCVKYCLLHKLVDSLVTIPQAFLTTFYKVLRPEHGLKSLNSSVIIYLIFYRLKHWRTMQFLI